MKTIEITAEIAAKTTEATVGVAAAPAIAAIPATSATPAIAAARADALAMSLAEATPTAGALSELEFGSLSPAGCLDAVVAWERLTRHAHAGLTRALGALAHSAGSDDGLAESEVSAALGWSPATAQNRFGEAHALTTLFPATLQLLAEGRVSVEQARCLTQLTCGLEDTTAQAVQTRVLPRMPGQSVAVTRQAIRRAIVRADPDSAAKRHKYERERRRVELIPENDGMATLNFYLPADIAQMAMRTLTALAQTAKRKNKNSSDKRTLDQRRADLLPALLFHATNPKLGPNRGRATNADRATGADRGTSTDRATGADRATSADRGTGLGAFAMPTVPARVNVTVSIDTLFGLSHEPGHLQGYGPICPEQTRRIAHAHAAQWRFLLTSTDGTLIDASPRTYTPIAAIKHLTQLKFTTCAFPHCHMPADRCDLDHATPYAHGGTTTPDNLAPLCRRHHNHKTHGHWQLNRHDNDTNTWTSTQTGRTYTTQPTRYPLAA